MMYLPVLQSSFTQTGPHLLAAGGQHVVVQFNLLMVRQGYVTVQSWLDFSGSWMSPASPEVNTKEKPNDKLPHIVARMFQTKLITAYL